MLTYVILEKSFALNNHHDLTNALMLLKNHNSDIVIIDNFTIIAIYS